MTRNRKGESNVLRDDIPTKHPRSRDYFKVRKGTSTGGPSSMRVTRHCESISPLLPHSNQDPTLKNNVVGSHRGESWKGGGVSLE